MALVLGTNCGFVEESPVDDPDDIQTGSIDTYAVILKHTSPATAIKITEIGWWCDNPTEEANFEVGLYAADGVVVPGEAGTLLEVSRTNAKGTVAGWKRVVVDWSILSSTDYWLGVQIDDTATSTFTDYNTAGGSGEDYLQVATLPDPFGGGAIYLPSGMIAIYAVWEAAGGGAVPFGGLYGKALSGSLGGRSV